ncbi:TetR/AcrR family transcriptional regulator (plasmid) [Halarchaeum sp. CBA1220]|uniref:TetR/AcrR family transcriptional regulator n=1 Tax=Halarchaeum sp. CBA1220 TaxID=1853682 RepID=UPI00159FEC2E|nr:TetR/AcrR family transcriptional regulator [Halarchaeum sp. CBA1220]QLC35043.1 TetR/AcrR family transcriptional regulator [Halarchaeum sp. CBA1220]
MPAANDSASSRETREAIMEATFRALSEHGYTDLRVRDIGEEFEKSRTLIHYHFDGKHDLISAFLEYLVEQYEDQPDVDAEADPWATLEARIEQCLFGPELGADFDHWERMTVYHELFSQAQHHERHRELFTEHYAVLRENVAAVLRAGIEQGAFRDVDVDDVAQLLTDVIHAARARKISLGHDDAPEQAHRAVVEHVFPTLEPEDGTA